MSALHNPGAARPMADISLVVTCFNEARSIPGWCRSMLAMRILPAELIIADADSTDGTVEQIRQHLQQYPGQLRILSGKCNIPAGRNKAIAAASHDTMAITDFGVTFHPEWLAQIAEGLAQHDWVGGVYELVWGNAVERSFCRLFNVAPALLDEHSFLPSSRSFGLSKAAFKATGGYDERLSIGEDTEFVLRLKKHGLRYQLRRQAMVYWTPRSSIKQLYLQNFRYAYWDGVANQNRGRWNHIAFLLLLLGPLMLALLKPALPLLALGLCAALLLLTLKTLQNTRRSAAGFPRPMDLLVYGTTLAASSIGFLTGLAKNLRSRFS